jgi:hypothetical protein
MFILLTCILIFSNCEFFLLKSEPERNVFGFFNELNLKDVERIYDRYLLNDVKSKINKDDFVLLISKTLSSIKKIELNSTSLLNKDDERAIVKANFTIVYIDNRQEIRTEEIYLFHEDEKWKINFDKTLSKFK